MISGKEALAISRAEIDNQEIRMLIETSLAGEELDTADSRLILASDLLMDAAFEIFTLMQPERPMTKIVFLDRNKHIILKKMAVFKALERAFREGRVSEEELRSLAFRSSLVDLVTNALDGGASPDDLAGEEAVLVSTRLNEMVRHPIVAYEKTELSVIDKIGQFSSWRFKLLVGIMFAVGLFTLKMI